MSKQQEIILKNGKAYVRETEDKYIGWQDNLLQEYQSSQAPNPVYSFRVTNNIQVSVTPTKVLFVSTISGFEFSCRFVPIRVDDGDVFFVPSQSGGVVMTLPWVPPSDAICVVGYMFDRLKNYMDSAFIYLLPNRPIQAEEDFSKLMRVPALTNIWDTGEICLGNSSENKPTLNQMDVCRFQEDFLQRMSTIRWNNDLFPTTNQNLALNRWNGQGQKEPYQWEECPVGNNVNPLLIQVVQDFVTTKGG